MNAKSSIPDYQHAENLKRAEQLRAKGYRIEVTSQGYQIWNPEKYLGGAGTVHRPHGRYAEANRRDYLAAALSLVKRSAEKPPKFKPSSVIIFEEPDGFHISDASLSYLDARGKAYPSKAAAMRAAREEFETKVHLGLL